MDNKNFSEWHGIDRKKIEWFPSVDENKCIGCGLCVTTCGRGVYKYDFGNKKSKVVNPYNYMVACQTCSNLCPMGAINFVKGETTREKAQKIVKDFKVLPKIKEELKKRKEDLDIKS